MSVQPLPAEITTELEKKVTQLAGRLTTAKKNIHTVIFGQETAVDQQPAGHCARLGWFEPHCHPPG